MHVLPWTCPLLNVVPTSNRPAISRGSRSILSASTDALIVFSTTPLGASVAVLGGRPWMADPALTMANNSAEKRHDCVGIRTEIRDNR